MVQKTLNNLKEGPKEDKVVVASGVALTVVLVLLIAWTIFFLRGIRNNSEQLNVGGGAGADFYSSAVKDAQAQLQGQLTDTDELNDIRARAASGDAGAQLQAVEQETAENGADQFGASGSMY